LGSATSPRDGCRPAVFVVFILLAVVYATLYFRLYPIIPGIGDDWTYLALWRSLLPSTTQWNPARILPEFLMPLSGYFAAYILRPLCGLDYLQSLIFTCSGLAMGAQLTLNAFVYRFFYTVTRERFPALCGLLLFNVVFFQAREDGLPLVFHSAGSLWPTSSLWMHTATQLFAYILPNILNAVLLIILCQAFLSDKDNTESVFDMPATLLVMQKHKATLTCGFILAYFAQFSMTISSAISAIPAGCLLLFRLIQYAKNADGKLFRTVAHRFTFLDMCCFMLVAFWFIAAAYDLCGGRYAELSDFPHKQFSFLAILISNSHVFPRQTLQALIFLIAVNTFLEARDKKNCNEKKPGGNTVLFFSMWIALSFFLILTLNILIFYLTNKGMDHRFLFGMRLYIYIAFIVNLLFLQKRIPQITLCIPFLILLYFTGAMTDAPWVKRPMQDDYKRQLIMREWIDATVEADRAGKSHVTLYKVPDGWPYTYEWYSKRFSLTLFRHGITSKLMTIHIEIIADH